MACSIEMLPCDRCGQPVPRYAIHLSRDEDGQRLFLCPSCADPSPDPEPAPPAAPERPTCD